MVELYRATAQNQEDMLHFRHPALKFKPLILSPKTVQD